jgi:hypothetical protein
MIAEAASAGKGPLVYQASENGGRKKSKQDRMVDGLLEAGYGLRAGDADKLTSILDGLNSKEVKFKSLDDTQKAAERLQELIK